MYRKSDYKGVSWHQHTNKWQSQLKVLGRVISLGVYDDEQEAGDVYEDAVDKINQFLDRTFSKTIIQHQDIERLSTEAKEDLKKQVEKEPYDSDAAKQERKLQEALYLRDQYIKAIDHAEEIGITEEQVAGLKVQLANINKILGAEL